jgi:hypothetical protein
MAWVELVQDLPQSASRLRHDFRRGIGQLFDEYTDDIFGLQHSTSGRVVLDDIANRRTSPYSVLFICALKLFIKEIEFQTSK